MRDPFHDIVKQISTIVLGKKDQIRLSLTCLFAKGHLLIEDIPGIGKTTLAKALSKCLGLQFRRVQFTSDMLPGDILGTSIFADMACAAQPEPFVFHDLLVSQVETSQDRFPRSNGRGHFHRRTRPGAACTLIAFVQIFS